MSTARADSVTAWLAHGLQAGVPAAPAPQPQPQPADFASLLAAFTQLAGEGQGAPQACAALRRSAHPGPADPASHSAFQPFHAPTFPVACGQATVVPAAGAGSPLEAVSFWSQVRPASWRLCR